MKKPTLEDFNLTESSLKLYDEQCKKYDEIRHIISLCHLKRNKIIKCIAWIPTIIGIIIFLIIVSNISLTSSNIILVLLGIAAIIAYPTIILKMYHLEDYPYSDFDKEKRKNFEKSLPFNTNKYDYINKSLEQNITNYKSAVKKYEEYQVRISEDFWLLMNGYQFEREVAKLYEQLGYTAIVTPSSADGGVDIILKKNNEKIAVQCKHHKNKIGPNDIRALQGVVHNQNYTSGIFVSLNGFTPTVPNEARAGKEKIELITLKDLIRLQKSISM